MPRDSSGVFTLVDGYEAITGETIQPSQHNPPLEDIAAALTGSLPRNGSAPMLAPLKLLDGTAAAPALAFNSATGSGLYHIGGGIIGVAVGGVLVAQFAAGGLGGTMPIGMPLPVLDDALPALCVWADGRNVSRAAYAALFAKFGGNYGNGDGSTTFGVPDLRGRILLGRDNTGGTDAGRLVGVPVAYGNRATTGSALGENLTTLLLANMPAHNHAGGSTDVQGSHVHAQTGFTGQTTDLGFSGSGVPAMFDPAAQNTGSGGAHGHTTFLPTQGSGTAHNNVQSSLICNWAIYAGA